MRNILYSATICFRIVIVAILLIYFSSCNDAVTEASGSAKKDSTSNDAHADHAKSSTAFVSDYAAAVNDGRIKEDTMKGSPHRTAMATVGNTHVHITYSSPGTKGRVIWGGLVAYNKVWVAGAHQATKINFNKDVNVNGKTIPAGDYAFFAIPGEKTWTLILNKNAEQHLADDYTEKDDALRITVTPSRNATAVQRLTYTVSKKSETEGAIKLEWDELILTLPFTKT